MPEKAMTPARGEERVQDWIRYVTAGDEAFHQSATLSDAQAVLARLREVEGELAKHETCIEEYTAAFGKSLDQALDRAELAEQRVAGLADELKMLLDSFGHHGYMGESGECFQCTLSGAVLARYRARLTALTPPPPAP